MRNLVTILFGTRKQKYSEPKLYEVRLARRHSFGRQTSSIMERIWQALWLSKQDSLIFGEFRAINMLKRGYLAYAVAAVGLLGSCSKDGDNNRPKPDPDPTPKEVAIVYNNDADLWLNTATVAVKGNTAGKALAVQYRVAGSPKWTDAVKVDNVRFRIEPTYDNTPADGKRLAYKTLAQGTGVRPHCDYEVQLLADKKVVATTKFSTASAKDAIPNAGMDYWCEHKVEGMFVGGTVASPNKADGEKFWTSGNNGKTAHLCTGGKTAGCNGTGCAVLKGETAMGVFAAGNIFTGVMEFGAGLSEMGAGYARFGQKYLFTTRPTALKVRIDATLGLIDKVKDELKEQVKPNTKDTARIFFCITDWRDRHTVQGGLMSDKNTFWNPSEQLSVAEGKILGYGQIDITEDTAGWKEITIPVRWYDTTAKPTADAYSLVISAASSALGDYLTGSTKSAMSIEDFEWVY